MKRLRSAAEALRRRSITTASLFERARKAGERGLEIVTEALDDGDDGNGNAGRDQTVFDGSRAGLVFSKTHDQTFHGGGPLKSIWLPEPTQMVYEPFGSS